jgi:hypothetical protein
MLGCQYARLLIALTAAAVARSLPRGLLLFFAVACFYRCSRGLRRSLERKEAKVQERGDASARRPYSRPAPSLGKAFAFFY